MWVVRLDDRNCPFCRRMKGRTIGVEKNFFEKDDPPMSISVGGQTMTMKFDYEDIPSPPLHPHCRCTIAAVIDGT
jgi:hypothetical protein